MKEILKNFDLVPFDLLMIFAGALCFVIFWKALDLAFTRRFITLHKARFEASQGAEKSALELREEASQINAEFEHKLDEVRAEELKNRLQIIAQAKAEADSVIAAAEEKAAAAVKHARAELESKRSQLSAQVLAQAEPLAGEIADKIKRGEGISRPLHS